MSDVENKKIVIIGANEFQNPLILKAKEMGYETHVFAWKDGSVGEKTADYFYPISIIKKESILNECRRINPVGVASIGSDLAAITVNYIANALGLPANAPRTALIATNKYEMRSAFQAAGVPTPAFCKMGPNDSTQVIRNMKFPVIVKPTDRSGSRGITKLTSWNGVEEAIRISAAESFEQKVIVEEYIDGEEFSCECISASGIHYMLAITKKFTTGAPHFIETGHLEPAPLTIEQQETIRQAVFAALDALGISCGASHSEFKLTADGQVRLIEVGARMGGDCIGSDLVYLSTGRDFVKMTLQAALGQELDWEVKCTPKIAAVKFVFSPEDLAHLRMLEDKFPEKIWRVSVLETFNHQVIDSSSRYGFYIATCASTEEALELLHL